ncbi:hypothetical protein HNQ91_004925 [Filimonas zeae]|uniref:Uncharacterized protein n=1 Tax=Filimonas zeae TaxID=1737353 RepID=A0A917MYL2_9BACT|nr:hypothetical protein [Filimonas zeae]MDR6341848.1 hypothetical protein [Filimonas zeae]GGH80100.1 hypothetical protein GCM10011379_50470 [Filimonas zeae]
MPETPLYTATFTVDSQVDLPVFISDLSNTVSAHLPLAPAEADVVLFKLRVIVSELLTNTIKHTQESATTLLRVTITSDGMQLIRQDDCAPMHFPANDKRPSLVWPIPAEHCNHRYTVYEDDLNALSLSINDTGTASFYAWQNPDALINIPSLNEHFGLLMIALSTQAFTYEYQPATKANIFTASIEF